MPIEHPLPTPFPIPTPGADTPTMDLTPLWDVENLGKAYSAAQTAWLLLNQYHLLDIFVGLVAFLLVIRWLYHFVGSKEQSV